MTETEVEGTVWNYDDGTPRHIARVGAPSDSHMLTKPQALELVSNKLRQLSTPDEPFVIVDEHTIEKPFGWVFFYNSKKFLETGESRHRLAGNGPVIVNKLTGTADLFGSSKPPLEIIENYEREWAKQNTLQAAERSLRWKGDYLGMKVIAALPIDDGCKHLILLEPMASGQQTFENLLCVKPDGSLIWKAQLPQIQDAFVSFQSSADGLFANTWGGYRVRLDAMTGMIIDWQFVK